jgi:hypothetical protein
MAATMWYAQPGWRLVYSIVPEADVPVLIVEVNTAEGIPAESVNRGKSWLWVQGLTTTHNLNDTITLASALGVQVVFLSDLTGPGMNGYVTNVGDYQVNTETLCVLLCVPLYVLSVSLCVLHQVNTEAWPNGLREIRERLAPHGLEVGFHMLSSGTSVCMVRRIWSIASAPDS